MLCQVNRTYGSAGRVTIDYETVDGVAVAGRDYVTTKGTLVFEDGETAKDIKIPIILDETPDEHENFCISLANVNGGASMGKLNMSVLTIVSDTDIDSVASTLANLIRQRDGILGQGEQSAWSAQFIEAIELEGNVNELGETVPPTPFQACMHFVTIFWKLLFATIPPTDMCGGWATFGVALSFIGVVTAVVGDVATLFGCVLGLKNSVTAISVVALGTSLPDTFASKQAVTEGNDADAAVGNITGSNSVNVFLGLGLPYLIGTIYSISKGEKYCNPAGSLVFSVIVYSSLALACLALLAYRRKACGAELGGNNATKYFHAVILVLMWVCYITLSSLQVRNNTCTTPLRCLSASKACCLQCADDACDRRRTRLSAPLPGRRYVSTARRSPFETAGATTNRRQ